MMDMVSADVAYIMAVVLPVALLVLLRINAAQVFLSLCLGYVLVQFVADDADSLITFLAPDKDSLSASTLRLIMLLLPAVLTACITLLSIRGRLRALLNILPASGAAVLGFIMAVPLLPPNISNNIQSEALWQEISRAQALVVGASALISLLFLWAQRRHAKRFEQNRRHRF